MSFHGAVPSLLHLAYIPANLPDSFLIPRQRALMLLVACLVVLLGVYIAVDLRQRFDHLNHQVRSLRADLHAAKRTRNPRNNRNRKQHPLPEPLPVDVSASGGGAAQFQAARELLQALGPAVVTPSVLKEPLHVKQAKGPKDKEDPEENVTVAQPFTPKGDVIEPPALPAIENPNFGYIINNPDICSCAPEVTYLVYIHSAPDNFRRRASLRATWARGDLYSSSYSEDKDSLKIRAKVVFFLGTNDDATMQHLVKSENKKYGDIIQTDFIDTDCNSTYKAVAALKWITQYCSKAKYIFKADDDSFVNIFLLMDILLQNYVDRKRFLVCLIWDKMPVVRPHSRHRRTGPSTTTSAPTAGVNKCKTDDDRFSGRKYYPRYCSGAAYFLSGDVIPEMYAASRHVTYYWVDDVYVTGILTQHLAGASLTWVQEGRRYRYKVSTFHKHYNTAKEVCLMVSVVATDEDMLTSWRLALRRISGRQRRMIGEEKYQQLLKEAENTENG